MYELHPIRRTILFDLLHAPEKRFSDLKPERMEGSQFTYHLDELIKDSLVKQNENGSYSLTQKGSNYASKFDYSVPIPVVQAKLSVIVCPIKNGDELLVYRRNKKPYFGCQGFLTGKIQYGETTIDAAKRKLKEETHLEGSPELIAIRHYRVYDKETDKLLEDKFMYIHKVINPTGELLSNSQGDFFWIKRNEIAATITKPLEEFFEVVDLIFVQNDIRYFKESIHKTFNY